MDTILSDIQQAAENRIETLKAMEDLETRLQGQVKVSSLGTFELKSELKLTEEERSILQKSISAKHLLFRETSQSKSQTLSGAARDGFKPAAGWDQGYVLTTLALDDKTTKNLVDLMKAGAGVSAVVTAICAYLTVQSAGTGTPVTVPIALVSAVAAGLLVLGSSVLAIRNRNGGSHGVYWKFTYLEILLGPVELAIHSQVYFARYK